MRWPHYAILIASMLTGGTIGFATGYRMKAKHSEVQLLAATNLLQSSDRMMDLQSEWEHLKYRGIYFVTQEKSNSAAIQISTDITDRRDPRNEGVVSDYFVGRGNGAQLGRVVYTDPREGTSYTYITNEMTLPAWAIVLIYKQRWNIEKVFYQFKSKMEERKSWASSEAAKEAHGVFECLSHNLALLFELELKQREEIEDEVESEKQEKREPHLKNRAGAAMKKAGNFINEIVRRATHRTQRFIRWLRVALYRDVP